MVFLEWLPWILLMNRPGKQFKKPKKGQLRFNRSVRSVYSMDRHRVQPEKIQASEKERQFFISAQSDSITSQQTRQGEDESTILGPGTLHSLRKLD